MNTVAKLPTGEMIENVITKGDLSKLTPDERTQYYVQLCRSMGLNPHTQPFAYINLSGKLTLYAKRDAADQLRKINGISIEIVERSVEDGLFTVHVRAKDSAGRTDEDYGVVPLPDSLKGEVRANQILKAITKAKRRVTLSISGLGFLDETEVDDIPASAKAAVSATGRKLTTMQIAAAEKREHNAQRIANAADPEAEAHAILEESGDRMGDGLLRALREGRQVPPHDADGVIIWDSTEERPATAADEPVDDGLDIPAALDRRAKPDALTGSLKAAYIESVREYIRKATDAKALRDWWSSDNSKNARRDFALTDDELNPLKDFCIARIKALGNGATA